MMRYNRVGRTRLMASAVGFGTCQLRLVPDQQAMNTLKRAFELGVNLVHTSPDYEGADVLVARAVEASQRDVIVMSQGYGDMWHFEYLFERACRIFKKRRLDMFGIGCIDDREYLGEDVWGPEGMIKFLQNKKREGRLTGIYCSTHGQPEYVARLVRSGCFDAIMLSCNALGFHLLSYHPQPPKEFEDIAQNRDMILPLAARHGVALFIMKPLAGGLLCKSRAFPPHQRFSQESASLSAKDLLQAILIQPGVCSVIPGTASVEEAEENALAGHSMHRLTTERLVDMERTVLEIRGSLCSRCGDCEPLCSRSLPISWLFRDAYISNYPSETFETLDRLQYFHLHPWETAACACCDEMTCQCPHGIDIPSQLIRIHEQMLTLRDEGLLPPLPAEESTDPMEGGLPLKLIRRDVPRRLCTGQEGICRFCLENRGKAAWRPPGPGNELNGLVMGVLAGNRVIHRIPLRHEVGPGDRGHFSFTIKAPGRPGDYALNFILETATGKRRLKERVRVFGSTLSVARSDQADPSPLSGILYGWLRDVVAKMKGL